MTTCWLCGGDWAVPVAREAGFDYGGCRECAVWSLTPIPGPDLLAARYSCESGATFDRSADRRLAYERGEEARRRMRIVGRWLPRPPARILEIGCGSGDFLAVARRAGYSVAGLEVNDPAAAVARERHGIDVRCGDWNSFGARFDAVVLFDVLSHIADPLSMLAALPADILVLETGNVPEIRPGLRGVLGAPEHVHHFSSRAIHRLLRQAGWQPHGGARRNVRWQRAALALKPRRPAGPRNGPAAAPAPLSRWRNAASWALLSLRFDAGRFAAVPGQPCTLFAGARRRS